MDDANEYVDEVSSSVFPDDGNDSKVRITIFNFGGQAIFQNVQHLYMPRNSCYVIVFNMTDFAKAKATGTKSIDDMRFRIRSIRAHAMSKRVSEDVDDRTKHTPIVLIGTHFDEIKMKEKDGVDWSRLGSTRKQRSSARV